MEQNTINPKKGKHKLAIELLIILALSFVVFLFAGYYDILEKLVEFSNQHENWELDEFVTVSIFLVFALAFFSMRHWFELQKSEKALKRSENLLNETQRISKVGGWEYDVLTNKAYHSDEIFNIYGISNKRMLLPEEAIKFYHSDDRNIVLNAFNNAVTQGEPYDIEVRFIDAAGKNLWVRTAGKPVIENDKVVKVVGYVMDITERKQLEEAVIESQRLGAIGEMTSAIAHDFNNSLQAIFGNLELALLNPDIPERVRNYLKVVKDASGDAAARVQLLQRFGAKKQGNSQHSSININTAVSDVITQSRPLWKDEAEKKGLQITIVPRYREIPKIEGNDGELRSVVYNVMKNAVEAMPKGGEIKIETGEESDSVFVRITDSGTGMDEETKARIFQPFYSTKGFELGRGLGMSGAYSILQEHGGSIKVKETAPGNGTTIEMKFPVSVKEKVSEDIEPAEGYEGIAKILWVDDDKTICEVAKEMLDCLGHEGDVARSGKEALEYLAKKTYYLVITDLGMPGMTGWQLADEIKKLYKGKIKVAVVTGWGSQVSEEEKAAHGVGYVLGKPIKLKDLESLIGEVMQGR